MYYRLSRKYVLSNAYPGSPARKVFALGCVFFRDPNGRFRLLCTEHHPMWHRFTWGQDDPGNFIRLGSK